MEKEKTFSGNRNEIGKRISGFLETKGMTQKEFAEATGITAASLSRYINGTREPKLENLSAMAEALDVSLDVLVEGAEHGGARPRREAYQELSAIFAETVNLGMVLESEGVGCGAHPTNQPISLAYTQAQRKLDDYVNVVAWVYGEKKSDVYEALVHIHAQAVPNHIGNIGSRKAFSA
ncbi:MAG: helix-turn-helix transcriptional regulator [Bacteroidales bacterium]|nr:helix-turn-helix transcriptional regulator [Bacteroidales bacterium]